MPPNLNSQIISKHTPPQTHHPLTTGTFSFPLFFFSHRISAISSSVAALRLRAFDRRAASRAESSTRSRSSHLAWKKWVVWSSGRLRNKKSRTSFAKSARSFLFHSSSIRKQQRMQFSLALMLMLSSSALSSGRQGLFLGRFSEMLMRYLQALVASKNFFSWNSLRPFQRYSSLILRFISILSELRKSMRSNVISQWKPVRTAWSLSSSSSASSTMLPSSSSSVLSLGTCTNWSQTLNQAFSLTRMDMISAWRGSGLSLASFPTAIFSTFLPSQSYLRQEQQASKGSSLKLPTTSSTPSSKTYLAVRLLMKVGLMLSRNPKSLCTFSFSVSAFSALPFYFSPSPRIIRVNYYTQSSSRYKLISALPVFFGFRCERWLICVGWRCIIQMNFLKSESYSLSPDEYLQKFKNPHQIISTKGDPDNDEKDLADLNLILDKYYNDTSETALTKERIITELTEMVSQWMKDIAKNTKQGDFDFEEHGYGLKVFGSYCLKTNSFDGDIDMVCIVPEFINRERHFFVILTNYFRRHEHIRDVYTIPDAIVPLIRLTLYGVQIDLLLSIISRDFMLKNPDFFEEDSNDINFPSNPQELRSVNGYRTALYLKRKYADKYKNYRATLKAIKHWAMNKGIYSQIYGYLGGAAFSIMLAKICQLYPNYSALQLLDRFFFIYANWVWSISVIIEKTKSLERPLESEMAILTPLEPHMNAGHYISKITSNITRKHLRSASKLIQEINKGKKAWMDLFAPADFFNDYRNFIEISVMGEKVEDFVPWKGNIESKIRKFIQNLEQHSEISHGLEVNPYPRAFASKHPSFKHCSKYYIGIKCSPSSTINDQFEIDLTQSVRGFLELLENYPEIDKKAPKEINIGFTHITRENIPQDILEAFGRSFSPK